MTISICTAWHGNRVKGATIIFFSYRQISKPHIEDRDESNRDVIWLYPLMLHRSLIEKDM